MCWPPSWQRIRGLMSRTSIRWFLSEHWAESKIDSRFVWLRSSSTTQGSLNVKPKRRWPWFATPSFNKAIRRFDVLSGMSMRRNLPPRQWMRQCSCTRSSSRSGSPKICGSWAVGGEPASKSVRQPWQSCCDARSDFCCSFLVTHDVLEVQLLWIRLNVGCLADVIDASCKFDTAMVEVVQIEDSKIDMFCRCFGVFCVHAVPQLFGDNNLVQIPFHEHSVDFLFAFLRKKELADTGDCRMLTEILSETGRTVMQYPRRSAPWLALWCRGNFARLRQSSWSPTCRF